MNKIIAVLIAMGFWMLSLLCAVPVHAQDAYQFEISADYTKFEADDNYESTLYGVSAEVFFSPVKTADHPLAEAAFLERIGSVELFVGKNDSQGADGPVYGALATYMKPGSPLLVEALYYRSKLEPDAATSAWTSTADSYGLGIGSFLSDGLLLGFRYMNTKSELRGFFQSTTKYADYDIYVKNVNKKADGTAVNMEGHAGLRRTDDDGVVESNITAGVAGDYYFSPRLSAGAGMNVETGEERWSEGVTAAVNVNAYANPNLSAKIGYEKFFAHNEAVPDENRLYLTVSVRF